MEAQGFVIEENIIFQDNQSAIKVEDNEKMSSEQKTNHMDNRYFGSRILQSEGIKVDYCPTENMIADFFTKPLQGDLFKKFRDIVIWYKHISTLHEDDKDSSSQERVGKDVSKGNIKRYDDSPSVVGSSQRGMSYAEAVNKR